MLVFLPVMLPRSYGPPVQPLVLTKETLRLLQANASFIAGLNP